MIDKNPKQYVVQRLEEEITIDTDWDKSIWANILTERLSFFMGAKPDHFPKTRFKAAYDSKYIYVIFKVDDQYIRAVSKGYQASVCLDSCVEFFFTPSEDILTGYFNLETNCGGTILMYHQITSGLHSKPLIGQELDKIEIATSLPSLIKDEIVEPTSWTLEYKLPISILEKYTNIARPDPGVKWKANFYKCGDKTSHPHWLTWSFVDKPNPNFHSPDFFGTLIFA